MPRDDATLLDILNAAKLALEFKGTITRSEFLSDAMIQSAIIHQLLVIGEAAKRLSEAFRSGHPEIPWSMMARMRDKLIHHYNDVDPSEVWSAVESDIPRLIAALEPLVPSEE